MKFEVRSNGTVVMCATSPAAIPDRETQALMIKAGYRLYKDGKVVKCSNSTD